MWQHVWLGYAQKASEVIVAPDRRELLFAGTKGTLNTLTCAPL